MNIKLEALEEIPQLKDLILSIKSTVEQGVVEKRRLNKIEVAFYTGYTEEAIKGKVKDKTFIKGIHYQKPSGLLMFDKVEIDNWVMGKKPVNNILYDNNQSDEIIDDILSDIRA